MGRTSRIDRRDDDSLREGYERGDIKFTFHGERLDGSFALVRMASRGERAKPQWLLIKHRDCDAVSGWDISEHDTSVATGRTMDEIREGKSRVWHSNRPELAARRGDGRRQTRVRAAVKAVSRLPSPVSRVVTNAGVHRNRASRRRRMDLRAQVRRRARAGVRVRIQRQAHHPERQGQVASIPRGHRRRSRHSRCDGSDRFVLDGEIVAFAGDAPARFQALQSRMHVQGATDIAGQVTSTPSALIAFDLLVDGDTVLLDQPWTRPTQTTRALRRRAPAEGRAARRFRSRRRREAARASPARRLGRHHREASRLDVPAGRSIREWLKLKVEFRQEFVVGGYTEPRNTREHLGAMLLGYFDGDDLVYVGHTGGGFTRESLAAMAKRLKRLERKSSPFSTPVRTNEKAHWVRPEVVVEVKFNEWTADGRLRQPIFLGMRDDKDPRDVTREGTSVQRGGVARAAATRRRAGAAASVKSPPRGTKNSATKRAAKKRTSSAVSETDAGPEAELDAAEHESRNAHLTLGRGVTLSLSSLDKVWFPGRAGGYTKGDVLRHYVRVAPFILPVMADRPLVLKRFPDGINGEAFYQQKSPANPPAGVRVDTIEDADGDRVDRLVGGSLATLLYQVQLGTISVDPWHARVTSLGFADYSVIDLDPGPRAKFERVVEVATWVKEELDRLGLRGALKTSGSTGLHIFLPLPLRTSNEAALLIAQLVATRVANAHPREATVERAVSARPKATVYVDYLQNVLGKSVAAVYAVRARPGATVSTPLEWNELTSKLDPRNFTIETVGERFARAGDYWASAMSERNTAATLKGLTKR